MQTPTDRNETENKQTQDKIGAKATKHTREIKGKLEKLNDDFFIHTEIDFRQFRLKAWNKPDVSRSFVCVPEKRNAKGLVAALVRVNTAGGKVGCEEEGVCSALGGGAQTKVRTERERQDSLTVRNENQTSKE